MSMGREVMKRLHNNNDNNDDNDDSNTYNTTNHTGINANNTNNNSTTIVNADLDMNNMLAILLGHDAARGHRGESGAAHLEHRGVGERQLRTAISLPFRFAVCSNCR